jgi:hypothetical protein
MNYQRDNKMKTEQSENSKGEKPFLAARIPHSLEKAIESHVKSTGENKTQTIVKALGAYLGWSENIDSPNASDRLSLLEKKVAELEKFLKTPQQTVLLDVEPVIKEVKRTDNKKEYKRTEQAKIANTPELLTHKKLSDLTGINYNSVKSDLEGKVIEWERRIFQTTKESGRWKWKEVTNQPQEE